MIQAQVIVISKTMPEFNYYNPALHPATSLTYPLTVIVYDGNSSHAYNNLKWTVECHNARNVETLSPLHNKVIKNINSNICDAVILSTSAKCQLSW